MRHMKLDDYQKQALRTANPKTAKNELYHLTLGLASEAGEVAAKFQKNIRDQGGDIAKLDLDDVKKELGDVLWHVAVLADFFDMSLADVAETNIKKLASRLQRGKIGGSGDNR